MRIAKPMKKEPVVAFIALCSIQKITALRLSVRRLFLAPRNGVLHMQLDEMNAAVSVYGLSTLSSRLYRVQTQEKSGSRPQNWEPRFLASIAVLIPIQS